LAILLPKIIEELQTRGSTMERGANLLMAYVNWKDESAKDLPLCRLQIKQGAVWKRA